MKYIDGDLLEGDWDCAFHCANVHRVMGSGVALALSRKWPIVSQVDEDYEENGYERLGKFTKAQVAPNKTVYNLYGQVGIGHDGTVLGRNCQYDHLYNAMYRACEDMFIGNDERKRIGVPYKMASDRAGGSWLIVDAMLADLEDRFQVTFIVYCIGGKKDKTSKSSVYVPKLK